MVELANAVLGLRAETSIHAGAGSSIGPVDLPIQREAHTDWPVIFGSSMKGAMRSAAEGRSLAWVDSVFGPGTKRASENAGCLIVGDARLLFLPVRSLTTHYRLVTCPAILRRLCRDLKRVGASALSNRIKGALDGLFSEGGGATARDVATVGVDAGPDLYLEELRFAARTSDLSSLLESLHEVFHAAAEESEIEPLVTIIDDSMFRNLCRLGTPVTPHVALDSETKTVKSGQLWFEETLPPDTVMYSLLHSSRSRRQGETGDEWAAGSIMALVEQQLLSHGYLQVGGNETVGMGWFATSLWRGDAGGEDG